MYSAPVPTNVRYAPNSDRSRHQSELTRCAINGLMHCSKQHPYSITSSAIESTPDGEHTVFGIARFFGGAQGPVPVTVGTSRLSCGKAVKREYSHQFGSHPGNPGLNRRNA
jgi:hypothetical protein